ncbi:hypothetical protein M427DRAFT_41660 [Gonapodya prolifera JEL478]|uniref:Uncharacterized protein n=1 Tax=Gonapodya prolifera (strain JEL478) TaxID=1344416 RepID=A0A139ATI4_GONPJ|nr:hypothetical protein M427DRAFT_41660 [Gonapodya prolifera JEL478]|eukprot:KXS19805.1 hypothetical protein M427DRAFT_41660 [Gonapodya prolifera JEL478]
MPNPTFKTTLHWMQTALRTESAPSDWSASPLCGHGFLGITQVSHSQFENYTPRNLLEMLIAPRNSYSLRKNATGNEREGTNTETSNVGCQGSRPSHMWPLPNTTIEVHGSSTSKAPPKLREAPKSSRHHLEIGDLDLPEDSDDNDMFEGSPDSEDGWADAEEELIDVDNHPTDRLFKMSGTTQPTGLNLEDHRTQMTSLAVRKHYLDFGRTIKMPAIEARLRDQPQTDFAVTPPSTSSMAPKGKSREVNHDLQDALITHKTLSRREYTEAADIFDSHISTRVNTSRSEFKQRILGVGKGADGIANVNLDSYTEHVLRPSLFSSPITESHSIRAALLRYASKVVESTDTDWWKRMASEVAKFDVMPSLNSDDDADSQTAADDHANINKILEQNRALYIGEIQAKGMKRKRIIKEVNETGDDAGGDGEVEPEGEMETDELAAGASTRARGPGLLRRGRGRGRGGTRVLRGGGGPGRAGSVTGNSPTHDV